MSTLTLGSHVKVATLGLAVAALVLTSGCAAAGSGPADGAEVNPETASETANEGTAEETGDAAGDSEAPSAAEGRVQSTSGSPGSAEIDSADVLASATIDSAVGGTVTATVRSVEVSGETMTVRWAVGWEDPAQPSDATVTAHDRAGSAACRHGAVLPALAVLVAVLLLGATGTPVHASSAHSSAGSDAPVPAIREDMIRAAVIPLTPEVLPLDPSVAVIPLETRVEEDDTTVVRLTADLLFDFDSADLTAEAEKAVGDLADDIADGAEVTVDGHTDAKGDDAYNDTLSQERADPVAGALRAKRPDLRITATGHGETQPIADNGTDAEDNPGGRALNRRVEVSYPNS